MEIERNGPLVIISNPRFFSIVCIKRLIYIHEKWFYVNFRHSSAGVRDISIYILFILSDMQVPKEWKLDPDWDAEPKQPQQMSHLRKFPSKWSAAAAQQDPVNTVKIVDRFVISRTDKPDSGVGNGSVTC